MRSVIKLVALAGVMALAACHPKAQQSHEQNVLIDSGNIPANADIEELPADESSGTSSTELENGDDNPDVNADLNNSQ